MRRAPSEFTTIRLGGDASVFEATTQAELVEVLRDAPDIRVLGGGSNVVAADEGVREPVVRITASGWTRHDDQFIVAAGTPWDEPVAAMVEAGRYGVEALSGIPGSAGATRSRTSGPTARRCPRRSRACGCSTGDPERSPRGRPRAGFGYRDSFFKRNPGSYVVLAVAFDLPKGLQRTDQVRRTGA